MADEKEDLSETRNQQRVRHHDEAAKSGYALTTLQKVGGAAASIAAIIGLIVMVGPWIFDLALADRDKRLHEVEDAAEDCLGGLEALEEQTDGVIEVSRAQFQETEMVEKDLANATKLLRMEMKLRHGETVDGFTPIPAPARTARRAGSRPRPAPLSRREKIKQLGQQSDSAMQRTSHVLSGEIVDPFGAIVARKAAASKPKK